eukprot:scaffold114504_cov37-Prasinocladus_malaysianus.AAC.2
MSIQDMHSTIKHITLNNASPMICLIGFTVNKEGKNGAQNTNALTYCMSLINERDENNAAQDTGLLARWPWEPDWTAQ